MLFDRFSEDEDSILTILRTDYCDDSSDFFTPNFISNQEFLQYWEAAKLPLADAFGDKLIVRKPVNVMVEDDELYNTMESLLCSREFKILRENVKELVHERNEEDWGSLSFATLDDYRHSLYEIITYFVFNTTEGWINNRYDGPNCEVKIDDNKIIKFTKGCKLMKIVRRLVEHCDDCTKQCFEEFRLKHSQILNDAKICADLCISIHPLDFLTASYNSNNWRSCMCWEDGEYRRGVIEMMNSPVVVIAYIESKKQNLAWNDLKWNSKRWREFFIVKPEMISGIKGYPYWNRALEDEALKMLHKMFAPVFKSNYADKIYLWQVGKNIIDENNNINISFSMSCGPAMYNDFYSGNDYHAYIAVNTNQIERMKIHYSGKTECVVCGNTYDIFDSEGDIACVNCLEHYTCCACGENIRSNEDLIEHNGSYYCRYCYEHLPQCDHCGTLIDVNNDDYSLEFCVCAVNYDSSHESYILTEDHPSGLEEWFALREDTKNMGKNETYKDLPLAIRRICGDCAEWVFKEGVNEITARWHCLYREPGVGYFSAIPIDKFTEKGLKALFDPEDIEYFKALKENKEKSA